MRWVGWRMLVSIVVSFAGPPGPAAARGAGRGRPGVGGCCVWGLVQLALGGVGFERELAHGLRDGDIDPDRDDVRAHVHATVREKLLVSNPSYLDD